MFKSRTALGCLILVTSLAVLVSFGYAAEKKPEATHMKFSSFVGPSHQTWKPNIEFARQLTEASGGKVIVDYYGAEALGKSFEHWDIVKEGLADIGVFCCVYTPSRFPLSLAVELPFFASSGRTGSKIITELLKKGLINHEFEEVNYIIPMQTSPAQIFSNKKIEKLEDFKGLRVTGFGKIWADTWEALGAKSVQIGYPDIYLALQRGTLDAAVTSWGASVGWKWQEVAKYAIDISIMSGWHCGNIMNKNAWNSLPPDVQKAWLPIFGAKSQEFSGGYDDHDKIGYQTWKNAPGREIIKFSDTERKKLGKKVIPVWEAWINREGEPAKKIYKAYVEVMKKLGEPVHVKIPGLYQE